MSGQGQNGGLSFVAEGVAQRSAPGRTLEQGAQRQRRVDGARCAEGMAEGGSELEAARQPCPTLMKLRESSLLFLEQATMPNGCPVTSSSEGAKR